MLPFRRSLYNLTAPAASIVLCSSPFLTQHAGVNRSSMALCYYCARRGGSSWDAAKAAIVASKGAAARGWPTLENPAFEALLSKLYAEGGANHTAAAARASAAPSPSPKWFTRTVATARPSAGGPKAALSSSSSSSGGGEAASATKDWQEQLRETGVHGGRTYGCWEDGRQGGVWVRGVPGKGRPWEGKGDCPIGLGAELPW